MNAEVCKVNKHCTSCPKRVGCEGRAKFYSNKEYYGAQLTAVRATYIIGKITGRDFYHDLVVALHNMDAKKDKELEEHPTYSNV